MSKIIDFWTWWMEEWTWWMREIIDLWTWFKWRAIWVVQRLTRYFMPYRGLKAGFRFGPIRVDEVEWYEWGNRLLEPQIEYHDGKRDHVVNWKRFSWLSWEEFLSSSVKCDIGLPENCVWVCDERELP